jgi:hypothetical protein
MGRALLIVHSGDRELNHLSYMSFVILNKVAMESFLHLSIIDNWQLCKKMRSPGNGSNFRGIEGTFMH